MIPQTLYIIRGMPGSGKTTLARRLAPHANVAADDFMVDSEGNYVHDASRYPEVHAKCENCVQGWMEETAPTIAVHNTFGHLEHLQPYLEMARQFGYTPVIIETQNDFGSTHRVPEKTLRRMAGYWEGSLHMYFERKLGNFGG